MINDQWAEIIVVLIVAVALDLVLVRLRHHPPARLVPLLQAFRKWRTSLWNRIAKPAMRVLVRAKGLARVAWGEFRSVWGRPETALRASMILGALAITTSIGILFAGEVFVRGWQIWLWLICIGTAVASLSSFRVPHFDRSRTNALLVGIVVAAAAIRILAIVWLPPTLHPDEAGTVQLTMTHIPTADGAFLYPFRYGYNWQPSLYQYLQKLTLFVLGPSTLAIRMLSALGGTLAVLATYFLVSAVDSDELGLVSAVLVATSPFHIQWSALALNNIWDTVWVPTILGGYVWAWKKHQLGGLVLSGASLGFSQYFYGGSKLGILLLAILAFQLWRRDNDDPRLVRNAGITLALAGVIAAPIISFALANPAEYVSRVNQDLFWKALPSNTGLSWLGVWVTSVWNQAIRSAAGFTSLADQTGFFGGGMPLTLGLAAPLLAGGTIWALYQRRFLPVIWLGLAAFLGSFFLAAVPSSSHLVVAIPALAWVIAMAIQATKKYGTPWVAYGLLALIVATNLIYYFGIYLPGGASPDLNASFPSLLPR